MKARMVWAVQFPPNSEKREVIGEIATFDHKPDQGYFKVARVVRVKLLK